ncbi:MAG: nucleotidyltransferase [Actinobacteria bacterium]|nr:nucleotidyltransferase [Actinomycetota bacterium]
MLNELKIFKDVIEKLNNNNIPFMISGSVAMNYYTIPRMTRDIDIVIEIEDIKGFYNTFKKEYYIDPEMIENAIKHQQMFNIIHLKEVIKIDFIIRKNTEYRKTEFKRRKKVKIDGIKVSIVTIEDLIISKLLWARDSHSELQIRDIKNLLKERADMGYINNWVIKLNIEDFFQEIMHEIR